jgi:repressor LexA
MFEAGKPNHYSGNVRSTREEPVSQLSVRQQQVLDFIRATVADRGYPPSVREIGEAIGLSSPSTVHSHLSALVKAGAIRRDPSKPRAIEVLEPVGRAAPEEGMREVPLVGRIAAGSPVLAAEDVEDVYPLPESLVGSGPVFMLRIKGDSMVDAGILDGDLVVVRRQPDATDGDMVAALVEGEEATVKRLFRRDGKVVLHAENEAYADMVFDDGVAVLGKVVSVLRRVR